MINFQPNLRLFFQDQAHILEYVICDIGIMDKKRFPNKKAVEEQKADLEGADLRDANLTGAMLRGQNLDDLKSSGAIIN